MPIKSEIRQQVLIVRPVDSLNKASKDEFEEFLLNEIDEGFRLVVFDLSELHHVSSDGLLVMLKLINDLRKIGGEVVVTGLNSNIRVIFNVSGLFTLLDETEDIDSAITSLLAQNISSAPGESIE